MSVHEYYVWMCAVECECVSGLKCVFVKERGKKSYDLLCKYVM